MQKVEKYFPYLYVLFLIFCVFYVRSVLKEGDLKEYDDTVEKAEKVLDVDVTLGVNEKEYTPLEKLRSDDTVLDFLEDLRGDTDFYYEKTDYSYGTELDVVNGQKAPIGYKWKLYVGNEDITYFIGDTYLQDNTTYIIKLELE